MANNIILSNDWADDDDDFFPIPPDDDDFWLDEYGFLDDPEPEDDWGDGVDDDSYPLDEDGYFDY